MNLNIKGFIHLDFRKFKSAEELSEFTLNDDNFDTLANVYFDDTKGAVIKYEYLYTILDEIWVVDNYLVAKRHKDSDEIKINPDLARYLLEKSFNYVDEYNKEKKKESDEFISDLSIDSILDRISEVGFENITEAEKRFLDENS